MRKLIERLAVFFIGVPALYCLIVFLPFFHNLALNLVIVFFSALGAVEFSSMLEKKNVKISKIESFILGASIPLGLTLVISANLSFWIVPVICVGGFLWALISRIFSKQQEIETVTNKVTGLLSLFIYPGLFMGFIVFMSAWGKPSIILLFLLITFGNDSIAWLFGSLFGANNRGIIAVSPNKSIAGFIGGMLGSVLVAVGAILFFSGNLFDDGYLYRKFNIYNGDIPMSTTIKFLILGLCTGIAAILGDLSESAMKRSCDFKDSGNFMLGRGGVLDSIDSVAVAAPVFFLLYSYLFNA